MLLYNSRYATYSRMTADERRAIALATGATTMTVLTRADNVLARVIRDTHEVEDILRAFGRPLVSRNEEIIDARFNP